MFDRNKFDRAAADDDSTTGKLPEDREHDKYRYVPCTMHYPTF